MGREKSNRLTVAQAANYLGVDRLTVRLLLREKTVDWGIAYRLPGSSHFSYIIYADRFFAETGGSPSKAGD